PGSSASGTGTIAIAASGFTFLTGGSGTCITNCTGAPTWTASATGGTFNQSAGLPPFGAVYRFSVLLGTIPTAAADVTDTFTANYTRGTSSGATAAANTMKRYSLEIANITPPNTSANAGSTLSPVMTIA